MEEVVHVFIFVGSLQAFFFGTLILAKARKQPADLWFLALLLVMGVGQLLHYLRWEGYLELYMPSLLRVRFLFPTFIGPLFFLFILSMSKQLLSKKTVLLSLLPGVINMLLLTPYLMLSSEVKTEILFKEFSPNAYYLHYAISRISLLVFSLFAYRKLAGKSLQKNQTWLKSLSMVMMLNAVILIGINVVDFFLFEITSYYYINIVNTLLVFVIGYFTMRSSKLFNDDEREEIALIKYKRSSLSKKAAEDLLTRMDELMNEQHKFRQQGITQSEIAIELGTSTNHVSQALNQIRTLKFNEYINSYRVIDFQRKAEDQKYRRYTLLAIAESCGFGSKASFNTIFKSHTGKTPTKYLKSKGSILQE